MAEMGPTAEVCAWRPVQVWRALMDWVAFVVQIIVQIARGAQFALSHIGLATLPLPSLLASFSSSSTSFKPLPSVELSLHDSNSSPHVCVDSCAGEDNGHEDDHRVEKLTVVLDLDETLVCAYETSSLPAIVRNQAVEAGLKWFEMQCVSADKDSEGKEKINYVTVFERPGLQEFLEHISEFADLVLFTAGLEGYARPLVDKIDAENRFCRRLYRPSTVST
ncbi:hypothetical protein FH972_017201 [Carpinus fangiana]|nr:hypothetical protein FH972_017201 [Carpinus fangiana]